MIPNPNMNGFMRPNNYASFSGYGSTPVNPLTGSPDYAASLMPTISGLNTGQMDMEGGDSGGYMSGLTDWLKTSGFLGSTDTKTGIKTDGFGGMALGVAQGLGNAYMGMKQYGLAKESLAEGKKQFSLNYDAQKATTNSQMEDRQRARVASNSGAYQSVGDYMAQNGIK